MKYRQLGPSGPRVSALGIGIVAYSPLGRGLLTEAIKDAGALPADDRRRQNPRFGAANLERNVLALRPLADVAQRVNAAPAQVALAWLLAQGEDVVPIPGTVRRAHLEANAAAVDLQLTAADVAELARAYPPGAAYGQRHNDDALRLMNG